MENVAASGRLPIRDFFILPLIVILTVAIMGGAAEIGTRLWLPERNVDTCMVQDPVLGQRPRPMCVSRTKSAEGQWAENRYNDCGLRSLTSCRRVMPGTIRIAVVGSSQSWGYHTPYEQTWYARTADALGRECRRPVDVQAVAGTFSLPQTAARVGEAIALKPDIAIMLVTPFDLERIAADSFAPAAANKVTERIAPKPTGLQALQELILSSRAVLAAQHIMFSQPASYVPLYLRYGDKADFLRPPFSEAWRKRLKYTDDALGYLADKFKGAGIPLVVIYTPQQAQADIVSENMKLRGVDPYALDAAIGKIARAHGIQFGDLTQSFAQGPRASSLFLNVDGHMNGVGNAFLAKVATNVLISDHRVAAFSRCRSP